MTHAGFNKASALSLAGIAATFALAVALAPAPASAQGTPEQQQACQPDAIRLCNDFVPDVQKITACMLRKERYLSPACRAVFGHAATHRGVVRHHYYR
jgi:hypothetical protein